MPKKKIPVLCTAQGVANKLHELAGQTYPRAPLHTEIDGVRYCIADISILEYDGFDGDAGDVVFILEEV